MGLLGGDILYWENNNKEYNLNAHWEKINNNNKNTTFLTGYLKKKKKNKGLLMSNIEWKKKKKKKKKALEGGIHQGSKVL